MQTLPYYLPPGDETLLENPGRLHFTAELCVHAGGPSGLVEGRVWLTRTQLAFRPVLGQPHPQVATLQRADIVRVEVVQPRWLGFLKRGGPVLEVERSWDWMRLVYRFHVDDPEAMARLLQEPAGELPGTARERLGAALDEGIDDPGRYTGILSELSFPQGFWHTEALEDLVGVVEGALEELGLDLPEGFLDSLDLEVETEWGPEDYEEGPGSESWGRREQITRLCEAINRARPGAERQLLSFAEDLPEWEFDEPVWLLLSLAERARLLELGVLHELDG